MSLSKYQIKWSIVAIVAFAVALLFFWESNHLKIETDILESMPQNDPVLSDARLIIKHLPIQDRLFIDISRESVDRDKLVKAAAIVTDKLRRSGLFTKVGINDEAKYFPELMAHVTDSLPLLFNAEKLEKEIKPLLETARIKEAFIQNRQSLEQLEGIGRSEMIAKDPLGFSGIILRQLSALMPAGKAQFYQGQLISEDGKHALIIAKIAGSGTDTATGAKISALIKDIEKRLPADPALKGEKYSLNSVGAYRAALDNETTAKRDTRIAIILTTLGIALLLLFAFPRPLIGLLALLPSTVGAIAALFVCSFFFKSMSTEKLIVIFDDMCSEFFDNDKSAYEIFGKVGRKKYALSPEGPYKSFMLTKDLKQFIEVSLPKIYSMYFDGGACITKLENNVAHLKVTGIDMRNVYFEQMLRGYFQKAIKMFGKKSTAKPIRSLAAGDKDLYFQYELRDA